MKYVISRSTFWVLHPYALCFIMLPWKYELKEDFYQFFLSVFQITEAILT